MFVRFLISLALSQHLLCEGLREVCYEEMRPELRCFDVWAPFTNSLFLLPASPAEQNIHFKLFTVQNCLTPDTLVENDTQSFNTSHWNSQVDAKIIVHGFTDSSESTWITEMVQELLEHHALNVIVVDWKQGAQGPNYFQAVANTRVVGAQIATLIMTAGQLGSSPDRFHIIGHSLGGHAAGYAGTHLGGKLGRISGLDVAAHLFDSYGDKVRLEKTDAQFVDVIHTDAEPLYKGGFGTKRLIGHIDFFPNGGKHMPGCPEKKIDWYLLFTGQIAKLMEDVSCSHNKATSYFTASINDNDFQSYPCNTTDGNCRLCGRGCASMGYHAIPDFSGLYVTTTRSEYPY